MALDFKAINERLLASAPEYLLQWLPGGRLVGNEYVTGGLRGGPGSSLKFNIVKGYGEDFASGEKFGDLVSLYAAIEGIKQGEAAKKLAGIMGMLAPTPPRAKPIEHKIIRPPPDAPQPDMAHGEWGEPAGYWAYRDAEGLLFYVARYNTADGKQFRPWSWSLNAGRWVPKGWPTPRPLYGLDALAERPDAPVVICEGEKATDAAKNLLGGVYVAVCWPNGAKGVTQANWSAIYGRKVVIFPDNDAPGLAAARQIASLLLQHCSEIKIVDPKGMPEKWDLANALDEGWDRDRLVEWAKPRATVISAAAAVAKTEDGKATAVAAAQVSVTVNTEPVETGSANRWAMWEGLGITTTQQGSPHVNVDNALRILENHPPLQGVIWFDEFHQKYFTQWNSDRPREWQDVDTLNLATYMQRTLGLARISDEMAHKACVVYAHRNVRNEPRDWMESLVWDGTDRINWFLTEAYGAAEESEYIYSASRNFWIGMVARIFRPGCQLDNMVVLEGLQGLGKTQSLRLIGGPWYTEGHESVTNKDFFMVLHGKLIVEIGELNAFQRAEWNAVKQTISRTNDRYRAPYARAAQDHPRMSVFVGTTNESSYLRDDTGGRRFWPVKCKRINLEWIRENREQLFAEAVAKFKAGASWYEMPKEETEREQESRRHGDEWESVIYKWLIMKDEVSVSAITVDCLGIEIGKMDHRVQLRIGAILRKLGWEKLDTDEGRLAKIWFRSGPKQERLL